MRKLLTPHVRAIGRTAGPARDDAVDPARVEGTPAALRRACARPPATPYESFAFLPEELTR